MIPDGFFPNRIHHIQHFVDIGCSEPIASNCVRNHRKSIFKFTFNLNEWWKVFCAWWKANDVEQNMHLASMVKIILPTNWNIRFRKRHNVDILNYLHDFHSNWRWLIFGKIQIVTNTEYSNTSTKRWQICCVSHLWFLRKIRIK